MKTSALTLLLALATMVTLPAQSAKVKTDNAQSANQEFSQAPSVREPPTNLRVDVRFSGNKGFNENELRTAGAEILQSVQERGLTAPRADDAAFYLEVYYRRHGYTFAMVNWKITNGGSSLELDITEGPLTKLGTTTYQGNDHYTDTQLNDFLLGTTRERFSKFTPILPYVEQDVDTGVSRLISFYQSEGYLDAEVIPWPTEYTTDLSVAKLGFTVTEGLQYWFRHIGIVGASPDLEAGIRKRISETLKLPATALRMDSLQSEIQYSLKSLGYFKAEVSLNSLAFDKIGGLVDVDVVVSSGERYTYDGVTVKGIERLRADFLPARFSSLSGTPYNPELQDEIYREVITTGLFSGMKMKETVLPGNKIRLDLDVKENPAKEFGVYGGFGTYEGGFIGASFQDRNLLGNGRPLMTSIEMSQRGLTGNIEYVDPWFLQHGNELRVKIFSQSIDNEGYSILDLGVRGEVTRKFSKIFKAAVFAIFKTAKASPLEIDPLLLGPLDYQTITFGMSGTFDMRNNPLAPAKGWVVDGSFGYEQISSGAGGLRVSLRSSYYLPIKKGLLALGVRSSAFLTSSNLNEVPIDERYFNGGGTTVRSFNERELGPLYENNFPLGGLSRTILNAEFSYPIIGDLKAAVFFDAGNIALDGAFLSVTELRYGVGLGLRYDLPVGPIRLDYGINPDPRPGEASGAFHFSFGVAF